MHLQHGTGQNILYSYKKKQRKGQRNNTKAKHLELFFYLSLTKWFLDEKHDWFRMAFHHCTIIAFMHTHKTFLYNCMTMSVCIIELYDVAEIQLKLALSTNQTASLVFVLCFP
jgi:hypothetical protein